MNIERDGKLVAVLHRKEDWKEGLDFQTPDETYCQVGTWWYQPNQPLKPHRHIENPRPNKLTQECVIVMNGTLGVDLYDNDDNIFHSETLRTGDFMVMLEGGHGYRILEPDTKVVECKNGPFISVESDKVLI